MFVSVSDFRRRYHHLSDKQAAARMGLRGRGSTAVARDLRELSSLLWRFRMATKTSSLLLLRGQILDLMAQAKGNAASLPWPGDHGEDTENKEVHGPWWCWLRDLIQPFETEFERICEKKKPILTVEILESAIFGDNG